jgi:hypothetical protein
LRLVDVKVTQRPVYKRVGDQYPGQMQE